MATYGELPNLTVLSDSGLAYAYRDTGGDGTPLMLLQHFRGGLDHWDPALVDALAASRRVIAFDNVGVGGTSGMTPGTIADMAAGAWDSWTPCRSTGWTCSAFPSGASWPRRWRWPAPTPWAGWSWRRRHRKAPPDMHGWAAAVIAKRRGP